MRDLFSDISDFDKEFERTRARIRLSNPSFFGITKKQQEEYRQILKESTEEDTDNIVDSTGEFVESTLYLERR